ncbi:DUF2000 domain-containing protein [Paractinoplanes atraurantiacus]|uniref:DUF2000 domain-containing protein n=1 Tax=Paractinoplanes atraurantiacus TaxID=1036182 RepID=A0A285F3L5_9ACTN|nr:DUF2000 domain-containing protein [Actinoplanes atraurantiacus]SNY05909.1 Protein of unknown function [Actinoplanes atraurantiacus]
MIGFTAEEIDQGAPTRAARLKWVVVVDAGLAPGRAANAAICTAAATSRAVEGLLGDDAVDADGGTHPGLPWLGCTVLAADAETLRTVRRKAAARADFFVADMPAAAQHTRVYAEYLDAVKETGADDLDYYAVSIVGPRNPLDKIVGKLPLLG